MYKSFTKLSCILMILILVSCSKEEEGTPATGDAASISKDNHGQSGIVDEMSNPTILQIAIGSPDHTTLVAGVQATQLENVLSNPGPLTVFAPNDDAFAKLPEGTLENLLKDENLGTLKRIITFHAAPGKYTAKMLKDGMQLYQATGHHVAITHKDGDIYVNGFKILGSVEASNGMVHVIGDVLLPPEK